MSGWARNRGWERFAPAGALGFLLTIAIGAVVIGEGTPSSKAPAQEIAAYFAEHRSGHFLNATLVVLGAFTLYPWFLASLYRAIRQAEGEDGIFAVLALIGGLALLGPLLLQAAGWGAAALEAGPSRDPSVAAGLMDLGNMGFVLVPLPAALLIVATSLAATPGTLLPVWLARAGWVIAPVMTVGGVVGFLPPLMFVLFGLWLIAVAFSSDRSGLFRRTALASSRLRLPEPLCSEEGVLPFARSQAAWCQPDPPPRQRGLACDLTALRRDLVVLRGAEQRNPEQAAAVGSSSANVRRNGRPATPFGLHLARTEHLPRPAAELLGGRPRTPPRGRASWLSLIRPSLFNLHARPR